MADVFSLGTYSDTASWNDGTSKDTGDLRRKYNFGDRVSELAIAQDPFFRFVSQVAKKPTDDPEFKFTEQRHSYHKRYAYIIGFVSNATDEFGDAELDQFGTAAAVSGTGQSVKLYMAADYKSAGNITSIIGQSGTKEAWNEINAEYKNATVGLQYGIGVDIAMINIDLRVEKGFQAISENLTIGETSFAADQRLEQIMLSVGMKF